MKSKILLFAITALFLTAMVSAASLSPFTITTPQNITHNQGSFTMTFPINNSAGTAAGSENIDLSLSAQTGTYTISFSEDPAAIIAGEIKTITATVTFDSHQTGSLSGTITQIPVLTSNESATFSVPILSSDSISVSKTEDITRTQNGTIKVENTGNTQLSNINLTSSSSLPVTLSSTSLSLAAGDSQTITVSLDSLSNLDFGTNTITVTAKDLIEDVSAYTTLTTDETFCEYGKQGGNLSIRVDINSEGEDDYEWMPLDTITIDVDIKYEGNNDDEVEDIIIELGIFDSDGKDIADDFDFENSDEEKIELSDLDNDDDEDTATFTFVVPADLEDGNYKLAVKAYGDKIGEKYECMDESQDLDQSFYHNIKIKKEDDKGKYIAFQDITLVPTDLTCGDTSTLTVDVYNIGKKDQDQILVILKNTELGINLQRTIKNFDQGDRQELVFTFMIPQDAVDKTHTMELDARYDYKKSSDSYNEVLDETHKFPLRVIGCITTPSATTSTGINAILDSEAKAGQSLKVKATITNLGTEPKSYVVDATGYDNWATLDSISERIVTLATGQSAEVVFTLTPNSDATGQQTFSIKTQASDEITTRQVAVNIGSSGTALGGNAWLWAIGIINVILIILIIIVAVRLAAR